MGEHYINITKHKHFREYKWYLILCVTHWNNTMNTVFDAQLHSIPGDIL